MDQNITKEHNGWLDYPAVCARLNKWGNLSELLVASTVWVSQSGARTYAAAIVGKDLRVQFKRIRGSYAYKRKHMVSLSVRRSDRKVRLSYLLHELAHILNYRKGKLSDGPHGEAFCRTYARLLREVM